MKCAYCGKEAKGTKEHIISCAILDLFPECDVTLDVARGKIYASDPMIKDVCAECNYKKLSYIDSYAKTFIQKYFTKAYTEEDIVEIEYDYSMIQKMLLKYAYNDMRAHKWDCSFFDEEVLRFLLDEAEIVPKNNVTVLCGLAVNTSPVPEAMLGNQKLRWCKDPYLYSNSVIRYVDYDTGKVFLNDDVSLENFKDLAVSYLFKFNSVQFVLLCWKKDSEYIKKNNCCLANQYPYRLLRYGENQTVLPVCTNGHNYHRFGHVHVMWDMLFELDMMRKSAGGEQYAIKEMLEIEWKKEEDYIKQLYPRK